VILGDSITYGNSRIGTSISQTLEKKGHKALNLSVIGYGTDQEYLSLKQEIPKSPRVKYVVLNFCLFNDFVDNTSPVHPFDGYRPKPFFEKGPNGLQLIKDHINYRFPDYMIHFLRQRSGTVYLYNSSPTNP